MITLQIEITTSEELDMLGHFFNSLEADKRSKIKQSGNDYIVKTSGYNFSRSERGNK